MKEVSVLQCLTGLFSYWYSPGWSWWIYPESRRAKRKKDNEVAFEDKEWHSSNEEGRFIIIIFFSESCNWLCNSGNNVSLNYFLTSVFKAALRQITDKAREFGAGPLFNQILPLLMSPTLEDQERHLLVKVIDRILYKLDDLVRPYVHKVRLSCGVNFWHMQFKVYISYHLFIKHLSYATAVRLYFVCPILITLRSCLYHYDKI